jgi:hypothetical protein
MIGRKAMGSAAIAWSLGRAGRIARSRTARATNAGWRSGMRGARRGPRTRAPLSFPTGDGLFGGREGRGGAAQSSIFKDSLQTGPGGGTRGRAPVRFPLRDAGADAHRAASRFCFRRVKPTHDDGSEPKDREVLWLVIQWPA